MVSEGCDEEIARRINDSLDVSAASPLNPGDSPIHPRLLNQQHQRQRQQQQHLHLVVGSLRNAKEYRSAINGIRTITHALHR